MTTPARSREPRVGQDEPRTPTHSLPSYHEPTPETHRRLSREEEAELALTRTRFSRGSRWFLIAMFLVTLALVPTIQFLHDLARDGGAHRGVAAELANLLPTRSRVLPPAAKIKAAEKAIERESVVSNWLLPRVQSVLTGVLGVGNEQVYIGRDGWLFYRPDVEYVTGAPFLDSERIRHLARSGRHADSIPAILDFREQLGARGIELIIVPAPSKLTIEGEMLSRDAPSSIAQNSSFAEWKSRLESAGVKVFDPAPLLAERKKASGGAHQYLATDSHWRPEAMELVADRLAQLISPLATGEQGETRSRQINTLGDIAAMLKLPKNHAIFRPETVTIHEVASGGGMSWRARKESDILLLGDSFTNIYSLGALGWGESAGFAEHLSRALGGRPLDCLVRNSDGAFATREMLQRELARGRDRLAGKRYVVWEFAARELAFGDWKVLPLKLNPPAVAQFFAPKAREVIVVSGTVESVSPVPRPESVPYQDHILSLHLVDLAGVPGIKAGSAEALVYSWSMRDNVWTPAARLQPGDRVTLRLQAWSDVSAELEKFNRSEIDDPAVQLEEPSWGEIVP
ncbi:MAG: hypothetical protein M3Z64_07555 [Verrucomicrobiota bacterium]|nr:hypothetical protein [Verrucomicrobiota bacterium]